MGTCADARPFARRARAAPNGRDGRRRRRVAASSRPRRASRRRPELERGRVAAAPRPRRGSSADHGDRGAAPDRRRREATSRAAPRDRRVVQDPRAGSPVRRDALPRLEVERDAHGSSRPPGLRGRLVLGRPPKSGSSRRRAFAPAGPPRTACFWEGRPKVGPCLVVRRIPASSPWDGPARRFSGPRVEAASSGALPAKTCCGFLAVR